LLSLDLPLDKVDAGLRSSSGELLSLQSIHVRGEILDVVARCILLQEYVNPSDDAMEAKYVFPLDESAAVCGFEAFINEKHVVGTVKEKEQARREYKAAVEAGHGAYLMDEEAPNVFTVSVGNLPPRAKVIIKITFVMELGMDGDQLVFRLPNAVAPSTRESAGDAVTQEAMATVAALDEAGILRGGFSLELGVSMPTEIRALVCRSHPQLAQIKATATMASVRLAGLARLGPSFVLDIALAEAHAPRMWVQENAAGQRACMIALTPDLGPSVQLPRYHFVLDLSCSMEPVIDDARQLLALAMRLLPSGALFNVTVFGDVADSCFPGYTRIAAASLRQAAHFLSGAQATMGSTNMLHLWRSLCLLEPGEENTTENGEKEMPTAVVLLSDMRVPEPDQLLAEAGRATRRPRFFGVGLGDTCQRALMTSFCRFTGGQAVFPDANRRSTWRQLVQQQLTAASQPSLTDVKVRREAGRVPHGKEESRMQGARSCFIFFLRCIGIHMARNLQ
jgi:poly [ADP-ribose] polymerase